MLQASFNLSRQLRKETTMGIQIKTARDYWSRELFRNAKKELAEAYAENDYGSIAFWAGRCEAYLIDLDGSY